MVRQSVDSIVKPRNTSLVRRLMGAGFMAEDNQSDAMRADDMRAARRWGRVAKGILALAAIIAVTELV